jgi:hypothetical protein
MLGTNAGNDSFVICIGESGILIPWFFNIHQALHLHAGIIENKLQ